MPTDKRISELTLASAIQPTDRGVLSSGLVTDAFLYSLLLTYIGQNLAVGANISFGTVLPLNTTGKDGDVFIKTNSQQFAQKQSGIWTVVYTISSTGTLDGTVLYGSGVPSSGTGANNDTYINTLTGIFYKKASGTWTQVFSMASGPAGPQGTAGTNGTNGTNGNTILSGTSNPINTQGVNGDFYLNKTTYYLFGPKAAGVWPTGVSLFAPSQPNFVFREIPLGLVNSSNTVFTLPHTPNTGSDQVFLNGLLQTETNDYTIAGAIITFVVPPVSGDVIRVNYLYGASAPDFIFRENPTGLVNSVNMVFTLANTPISNTEQIYLNGSLQTFISDYTITGGSVTMTLPPITGDILRVNYLK